MALRIGTQAQADTQRTTVSLLQERIAYTSAQVSTGYKTQVYDDIGSETKNLVDQKSLQAKIDSYQATIQKTGQRMEIMQQALDQVISIAADVRAEYLKDFDYLDTDQNVRNAFQIKAANAAKEIARVLNVQFDNTYLFAGRIPQITGGPMPDPGTQASLNPSTYTPANSPLDFVDNLSNNLPNVTAAVITANQLFTAIRTSFDPPAAPNPPTAPVAGPGVPPAAPGYNGFYLADISTTTSLQTTVRIDRNYDMTYGVRGDDSAFKDILAGIYAFATLDFSSADSTAYFATCDLALDSITNGMTSARAVVGALGIKQQVIEQVDGKHEQIGTFLTQTISDIQDADPYKAVTDLQYLDNQLQASFKVTAQLRDLTLANFI
jgi:flagellar hook-associated protein 3 FlgL